MIFTSHRIIYPYGESRKLSSMLPLVNSRNFSTCSSKVWSGKKWYHLHPSNTIPMSLLESV